jgi:glycosyltransferase involved in cell wall biosynthesis
VTAEALVADAFDGRPEAGALRVGWLGADAALPGIRSELVELGDPAAASGRGDLDVVHVLGRGFDLAAVRRAAPRAALVLDLTREAAPRLGRLEARRLRHADEILLPERRDLQTLADHHPELARRAAVVPPAVDLDRFAPLDVLSKERTADARLKRFRRIHRLAGPTILFVGPYTKDGGLDLVLDVVFALRERSGDVRLAALPDGPVDVRFRDACERRALGLGHHGIVEWHAAADELPLWYALCTVVCCPRADGAGAGTARLAAAAGRPFVGSAGGSATDVVTEGSTGFLVPAGDPETLRAALEALVGDSEEASRLGSNGRVRAEQAYGFSAAVDRIEQAWRDAVEQHSRAGAGRS